LNYWLLLELSRYWWEFLLPALAKARQSANTLKCSANLRSIGQGIAMYVSDNKGTLPASYLYGHKVIGGVQSPDKPVNGYVHWSSFIFGNKASEAKFATGSGGVGVASNNAGAYASHIRLGSISIVHHSITAVCRRLILLMD